MAAKGAYIMCQGCHFSFTPGCSQCPYEENRPKTMHKFVGIRKIEKPQGRKRNKKNFWIPKIKKGALSRQLGIPEDAIIPMPLLERIKNTPVGSEVSNQWGIGKRYIKVTTLLKKRAVLAHTLKRMGRRR